jgi:ribosome-associated translation inhibitor RaiA
LISHSQSALATASRFFKEYAMQIQVNSDSYIHASEEFVREIETDIEQSLSRFAPQITRLEVHLRDEAGLKTGERGKRCLIEARLAGLDPIAASEQAPTHGMAIRGAVDKLETALDRTLGRLGQRKGRLSFAGEQS